MESLCGDGGKVAGHWSLAKVGPNGSSRNAPISGSPGNPVTVTDILLREGPDDIAVNGTLALHFYLMVCRGTIWNLCPSLFLTLSLSWTNDDICIELSKHIYNSYLHLNLCFKWLQCWRHVHTWRHVPNLVICGTLIMHLLWMAAHASVSFLSTGWWVGCPWAVACLRMLSVGLTCEHDLVLRLLFLSEFCHLPTCLLFNTAKGKPGLYSFVVSLLFLVWVVISSSLEFKNPTSQFSRCWSVFTFLPGEYA